MSDNIIITKLFIHDNVNITLLSRVNIALYIFFKINELRHRNKSFLTLKMHMPTDDLIKNVSIHEALTRIIYSRKTGQLELTRR